MNKASARMVGPFLRLPTNQAAGSNVYVQLQHVVCIGGNVTASYIHLVGDEAPTRIDMPLAELLEIVDAIAR